MGANQFGGFLIQTNRHVLEINGVDLASFLEMLRYLQQSSCIVRSKFPQESYIYFINNHQIRVREYEQS